ncbi:CPBP family intramembrane glutamic endopeptidase [Sphingomonas sp. CROZ-RG-20F-R02-07]|uniref:CPBP family intramembrane glutamic endopeptidase n=1 Tax=Sphingomonas sp. CROZ-RG-20F-R02-07 TaxID=2914832 RepID=UPI001F55DE40
MLAGALLIVALGALGWFQRGDRREFAFFKALAASDARQQRFRLWIVKAAIAFAMPALVGLAWLGRLDAIALLPPEFDPLRAALPSFHHGTGSFLWGMVGGAAVGGVGVAIWAAVRRGRGRGMPGPIGDTAALMPRNRAEIGHAALLSITAGITEELGFRLYLPLLVALVTGSAGLGFGVATVLFAAMHRYQGWAGILATGAIGVLLAAIYLVTGKLWVAMLLHMLIDLNGLVLRPLLGGAGRVSASGASPS